MYNVGIYLFNDVELLDFAGPYEVFSVTSELNDYKLFKVFTITRDGKEIRSVNGLRVLPDYSFNDDTPIDILVIPGGAGTKSEINDPQTLEWISRKHGSSVLTMTVCSGARITGKLGLLDGLVSTTHHEVAGHLKEIAPMTIIDIDQRYVDNGKLMSSGGISAGIDLSLHVVRKLYGDEIADKTIAYMEYGDWKK